MGFAMSYPENNEAQLAEKAEDLHRLVLDGTVHIEEPAEDPAPRVKGLIELFSQFLQQRQQN